MSAADNENAFDQMLLESKSLERVTFTGKQLRAFHARAVAEGRGQAAAEKAGGLSDADILALAAEHHMPVRFPHEIVAFARALLDDKPTAADAGGLSVGRPGVR